MNRRPVSIVIPVWNAADVTASCLAALRPTLSPADEVIVVDDGSRDSTPALLEQHLSWIQVIRHRDNAGFAASCNDGAAAAGNDIVIFLNNDTVPRPGWIEDLTVAFADPRVGAAGPMSDNISGDQQVLGDNGVTLSAADAAARVAAYRDSFGPQCRDTVRLVGYCLAVRTNTFTELGGFDTRFGQGGFEDDDLCLRVLLADWRVVVVKTAFMAHAYHSTFDANGVDWQVLQQHNRTIFDEKLAAAFPVSVLIRCTSASTALLQTLESVQAAMGERRFEVVLLTGDRISLQPLFAALEGDLHIVDSPDDAGWSAAQHAATGLRRILLHAGDVLTDHEVSLVLAAGMGTQLLPASTPLAS